jgi:prepilin-type N-terminal cleavage/methylation domain-containing protein
MTVINRPRAFTLVELLVVIAIIALLLSILMPALNKVREQAKLLTDAANAKQIGTIVALYQADNEGTVPVMFNRWTVGGQGCAKDRLLSVALAAYSPETQNLAKLTDQFGSTPFAPENDWGGSQDTVYKPEYFKKYLPKFYVCPFVRGKAVADYVRAPDIKYSASGRAYPMKVRKGAGECYSVFQWERRAGEASPSDHGTGTTSNHVLGYPHGTPKFGTLPWNAWADNPSANYNTLKNIPVRWGISQLRRVGASSLADATILYCEQGEFDSYCTKNGQNPDNAVYNFGSHKKATAGGSTAIMGDTHVEWVPGTRIGWQ